MIKKLKMRITAVTMLLLAVLLLIIMAAIYIFMYNSEKERSERILDMALSDRMAGFMRDDRGDTPPPEKPEEDPSSRREPLSDSSRPAYGGQNSQDAPPAPGQQGQEPFEGNFPPEGGYPPGSSPAQSGDDRQPPPAPESSAFAEETAPSEETAEEEVTDLPEEEIESETAEDTSVTVNTTTAETEAQTTSQHTAVTTAQQTGNAAVTEVTTEQGTAVTEETTAPAATTAPVTSVSHHTDVRFDRVNPFMAGGEGAEGMSQGWIRISLDDSGSPADIYFSQRSSYADTEDEETTRELLFYAAEQILARGDTQGTITAGDTQYRYKLSREKKAIALIDCTDEISTMRRLAGILAAIFFLTLIVFFVLSVLLAKWVAIPIEDAWTRQSVFFSNASHELKTPLAVISANLDVLTSDPQKTIDEQKQWFGIIRDETKKMSGLIGEMLYLSREEYSENYVKTEFDLSHEVQGVCLSMDALAFERGRTINEDVEEGIRIKGNRESICRMLNILVDNAISHSDGGEIAVSLHRRGNKAYFSVANEGTISPVDLERIFDRYYRTDASRSSETGGFGLGLAIAKAIAENHGGEIQAASEEGITTFTVELAI
ncbi:MAG: GHKL domain-containing protein [Oscillospiraceae bacterium]|nr:GHKL domain-containing protein [Oscillospiraceae bacterium]